MQLLQNNAPIRIFRNVNLLESKVCASNPSFEFTTNPCKYGSDIISALSYWLIYFSKGFSMLINTHCYTKFFLLRRPLKVLISGLDN